MINYFDIAIIVFIALFFFIGIYKGFFKTILSIISWGVAIAAIYFLGEKLGAFLGGTPIGTWINSGFTKMFSKMGDISGFTVIQGADGALMIQGGGEVLSITEGLALMKIPTFLSGIVGGLLVVDQTVAFGCAKVLTSYATIAIASSCIFLVVSIVFAIIKHFVKKALRAQKLKGFDRVAGGVLYLVVGVLALSAIMFAIDLMSGLSFMSPVIEMRNTGKIASLVTKYNPISLLLKAIGK